MKKVSQRMKNMRSGRYLSKAPASAAAAAVLCTAVMGNVSAFAEKEPILAVDPSGKEKSFSAVLYDNTNGLPTSEANDIIETPDGFLWIGSYSGLVRYDGNSFERVDSTTGVTSVVDLYVDSKERLWIGTNDGGAVVMENGRYVKFNKSDGLKSLSVRSITEDSNGNVYLATTRGVVMINDELKVSAVDFPQINDAYIRTLETGADDVIYGITIDGDLFAMEKGKVTEFLGAGELEVPDLYSVLPDPDAPGYVYVGNKHSEIYYGKLSEGFSKADAADVAPLSYINYMKKIDGDLWVCADNGIGYIDSDSGELMTVDNIPMNTSVDSMTTDYQGNLWFVSSNQGVMKIVPNQFDDIYEKYGLTREVVYTTCAYGNKLFIGTKNSGLTVLDKNGKVGKIPLKSSVSASGEKYDDTDLIGMLKDVRIRSIICDSRNRLWISTYGENSLVRYDGGNVVKFTTADGLPSERIKAVYECSDGSVLVACTGGVAVIRDDKVEKVYDESCGIDNTEILTVCEGGNNDIIVGSDGDGIYVISGGSVRHLGIDSGLGSEVVMRIKKDLTRDIYWIVTSNSIAFMDNNYKVTTVMNFPYSNNFDLYENSRGDMWILSSNGLYVVPVEQMLANGEIKPVYYGRDNGLSCITTSNSYSALTGEGDLFIAGTTGVVKVNIEKPLEDVEDIKLSIPYLESDGEVIYPDANGVFRVPADSLKLTVNSFVYNYSLVNPQVTYQLEGFDSSSMTIKRSDLAPIDYTNLNGGTYRFTIRISDSLGNNSNELSVKIVKNKKLYEQVWFRIGVLLFLAALIGLAALLYIRHRTKAFLKKEKENKMLIREMVEAFAKVIDMKDKYTNGHSTRVAEYTAMLTRELGYDEETVEKYYNIALLHDIGKVGIPPEVLNKPGKLTETEFNIIKSHSALGYNALKDISIMPELAVGAGAHHERPDGKGYPHGINGDDIPRVAQIIAVADTFDAMYSDRPYRKRMNFDKAVSIVREVRGTQLMEDVVDAFLRLVEKGEFRADDDKGGGSTDDIDNIRKKHRKR